MSRTSSSPQGSNRASTEGQTNDLDLSAPLLVGFGVVGRAVASALVARNFGVKVIEDRPSALHREAAGQLGVALLETPTSAELTEAVAAASILLPSPGVPDRHPVFAAARAHGVPVASEFDLAQQWDHRPAAAITGTNGKTTVTTMVADALERSGVPSLGVGNTEIPYVAAIDDAKVEIFVVEASSFRLAHSRAFRPHVAAWLNFAPDHLDAHATLEAYEAAKASIWAHLDSSATVVANADDAVVRAQSQALGREVSYFSIARSGSGSIEGGPIPDWRIETVDGQDHLVGPEGPLIAVSELARRQPHDIANGLATAAIALAAGATPAGVIETLRSFGGLPHRLELLGTWDEVAWYNDSKATVPQATVAAVSGFESVVLLAGGSGKGLSFEPLKHTVPPVRAVVALGDAASDVAAIFDQMVPVQVVTKDMAAAIDAAADFAEPGDAVLLSPACASFDWYANYIERGIDFSAQVRARFETRREDREAN